MRQFSETLPTLDRNGTGDPEERAGAGAPGFDAEAILKALGSSPARTARPAAESKRIAPATGAARRPFTSSSLPRASETKLSPARRLGAAIPGFDEPGAPSPAPDETVGAEAAARAAATAQADIAAAVAEARAEERQEAADTLEAERRKWVEELAGKLASDLDAALSDLHNRVCDAVTLALTPVLEEAMRDRAVSRFSETLQRLMGRQGSAKPVTVSGPQLLLDALTTARGGQTDGLKLVPSEDPELSATVNETTLRTTVRAWATTLAAANGSRHVAK